MEQVFVSNGATQLVLIPEDEIDRLMLSKLLEEGPLEIQLIRQPVSILGKSVKDGIIIRKKQKYTSEDDSTEIKDMQGLSKSKAHLEGTR